MIERTEQTDPKKSMGGHGPLDLFVLLVPGFGLLGFIWMVQCASLMFKVGDTSLFWLAVELGAVGVFLLFCARLPLYRQRRFLEFGPKSLNGIYKKLYYGAYLFIAHCILLLLAMIIA